MPHVQANGINIYYESQGEGEPLLLIAGLGATHHLWELQVECLPTDVPDAIEADVSELEIGSSLRVGDLVVTAGKENLADGDQVEVEATAPR